MLGKISHQFEATLWKNNIKGAWYFVSLPKDVSLEIRTHNGWQEEGWGRLKATAGVGNSSWETAIWFDTKLAVYLLPIKLSIRKKENLTTNKKATFSILI